MQDKAPGFLADNEMLHETESKSSIGISPSPPADNRIEKIPKANLQEHPERVCHSVNHVKAIKASDLSGNSAEADDVLNQQLSSDLEINRECSLSPLGAYHALVKTGSRKTRRDFENCGGSTWNRVYTTSAVLAHVGEKQSQEDFHGALVDWKRKNGTSGHLHGHGGSLHRNADSVLGDVAEWEIPWEDLVMGERIGLGSKLCPMTSQHFLEHSLSSSSLHRS